jgi:CRISPR-associated protein Cas1
MRQHLNTLYVTREGAYLAKDGAAVEVRVDGKSLLRVPLHNLEGIVALGWDIGASSQLMAGCAEAGVSLSFCNPYGKFMACVRGFTSGNILLRRAQYRAADNPDASTALASASVAAKLANSRSVLLRAQRDHGEDPELDHTCRRLARAADSALNAADLDSLRGIEGDAAGQYFAVFPRLIKAPGFEFPGRVRRPPSDPVNAMLSFAYSMLAHDCRSALESVGLDPQCGFLHRDRPGRPSLALDLMEEFRPVFADRCVLTVINRRQISPADFQHRESGAVELTDDARKKFLTAWQERKMDEIMHPFLNEKVTLGLLPFIQARLLARAVRGDLDAYPAFLIR